MQKVVRSNGSSVVCCSRSARSDCSWPSCWRSGAACCSAKPLFAQVRYPPTVDATTRSASSDAVWTGSRHLHVHASFDGRSLHQKLSGYECLRPPAASRCSARSSLRTPSRGDPRLRASRDADVQNVRLAERRGLLPGGEFDYQRVVAVQAAESYSRAVDPRSVIDQQQASGHGPADLLARGGRYFI